MPPSADALYTTAGSAECTCGAGSCFRTETGRVLRTRLPDNAAPQCDRRTDCGSAATSLILDWEQFDPGRTTSTREYIDSIRPEVRGGAWCRRLLSPGSKYAGICSNQHGRGCICRRIRNA